MAHYQVVMVSGVAPPDSAFVPVDHLAFRAGTLDGLRAIRANLAEAGVEGIIPIRHGNAWSLYFSDCESNKVECLVGTHFYVTQPFGQEFDLDKSAEEILKSTRLIVSKPEFRPTKEWQAEFAKRLEQLSSPFGSDKYGVESAWLADLPR